MVFHCENLNTDFNFAIETFQTKDVFRNYYTVLPPQNLLDDLLDDENDQKNVSSIIDALSGIQKDNDFSSRPFKYATAYPEILQEDFLRPFTAKNAGKFGIGRYGDGFGYGVFYSALDIDTSIKETLYHAFNDYKARFNQMDEDEYIQDRKMIRIGFHGKCVDLTTIKDLTEELTSSAYNTCQSLGQHAVRNSIDSYKAPSARSSGICLPIFNPKSITDFDIKNSFIFNFQIIISKKNPTQIKVEEIKSRLYDISEIQGA